MSIDFEKNPLNSEAEYGLNITSEAVEVVYHEVGIFKLEFNIILYWFLFFSLLYLPYSASFITIKKLILNLLLKSFIKLFIKYLNKYSILNDRNPSLEKFY